MSTWDDKPNDYEHAIAEIERLRAALKPFADYAADLPHQDPDHWPMISGDKHCPTVGDIRNAARALEQSASEAKK